MQNSLGSFVPEWVDPPGSTIARILSRRGISIAQFASEVQLSESKAHALIDGVSPIDEKLAERLSNVVGSSVVFWINRENLYRSDLDRLSSVQKLPRAQEWTRQFPIRDMIKFGWLSPNTPRSKFSSALCDFFAVESPGAWQIKFKPEVAAAAFRTSPTYESNPAAVAAWLRWAEIQSDQIKCRPWNPSLLKGRLEEMRRLTRRNQPSRFIPELQALCGECGVALVIAPAPSGCRASGATRFLSPEKALIVLSLRYKSDDHFWFTFFHETGHLLLHSKEALFLEDGSEVSSQEEQEANEFSGMTLIPSGYQSALEHVRPRTTDVVRLAVRIGISPGVLVGQLQHRGYIGRNQLNHLKRRFDWDLFKEELTSE